MTQDNNKHLAFPFHIGTDGKTAQVSSLEEHVKQELIQLLLTNLGERVFLPEFGGGVRQLIFESADETASGMTKAMMTQVISTWLGHRLTLENLEVKIQNGTIEVTIKYKIIGTEDSRLMTFQRVEE